MACSSDTDCSAISGYCRKMFSACAGGVCECYTDQVYYNGSCITAKMGDESCSSAQPSITIYSTCKSGIGLACNASSICECPNNYHWDSATAACVADTPAPAVTYLTYNDTCDPSNTTHICQGDIYMTCNVDRCLCEYDVSDEYKDNVCKSKTIGSTCSIDGACVGLGMGVCTNGTCACSEGMEQRTVTTEYPTPDATSIICINASLAPSTQAAGSACQSNTTAYGLGVVTQQCLAGLKCVLCDSADFDAANGNYKGICTTETALLPSSSPGGGNFGGSGSGTISISLVFLAMSAIAARLFN